MDREKFYALVRETVNELNSIMKVSLKEQVKDLAKSALGRSVRAKDPMFWPAGMLMLGLVEARGRILSGLEEGADKTEGEKIVSLIDASIGRHVLLWKDGYGEKIDYIDDALSGAALVKLYIQQNIDDELKKLCREAADRIYAYLIKAPREKSGAIAYNAERSGANVFADGIGQTTMFLSLYGKVFEVPKALELSREELFAFKRHGCDERSSLPYHGYAVVGESVGTSSQTGLKVIKKGVLSWGRAAGWLIMGLSEFVAASPLANTFGTEDLDDNISGEKSSACLDKELKLWYNNLSETLMSYQRKDGGFAWQIQATDGALDTSATGMILYGMINGNQSSLKALSGSRDALEKCIIDGRVGSALSSCDDFGVHYQTYGHYPWGQGAALAALSKMT